MNAAHTCARCAFFELTPQSTVVGLCHLNPPQMLPIVSGSGGGTNPREGSIDINPIQTELRPVWPEVSDDDWCSHFHPQ